MRARPSKTESIVWLWVKSLLNAVLFFALFMVLLPWGAAHAWASPVSLGGVWGRIAGATLLLWGLVLWCWCLDVFSRKGRGTPFPLDAPRLLVTSGPFAFVRNPLIGGELLVIWGEAMYFAKAGILFYAVLATLVAHLVVVYGEEPDLKRRFGREYEEYCRRVPRWFPRF